MQIAIRRLTKIGNKIMRRISVAPSLSYKTKGLESSVTAKYLFDNCAYLFYELNHF